MSDLREEIRRLREEAKRLPYGAAKFALLEEAVRLADLVQDLDLAYDVRVALMRAAFYDHPNVLLVTFAWCLAQFDRDPRRFEKEDLLREYKLVVTSAPSFPEIERSRLEMLLMDMERRFVAATASLHTVHYERRNLMVTLGDKRAARAAHKAMRKCRPDAWSDLKGTVACNDLIYYVFLSHWRQARRVVQPVVDGLLGTAVLPWTLAEVLFPLLRLGQIDEGKFHQRRGYRLVCKESHFVKQHAHHLRFVVLVGDMAQAKRLLERHLLGALNYPRLDERFAFFLAACLWTDRLLSQGTQHLKLRLPPGLPAPDAKGRSDVTQLGQWFTEQAQSIARRFDARNGNDYYQQQLDELPQLLRLAVE